MPPRRYLTFKSYQVLFHDEFEGYEEAMRFLTEHSKSNPRDGVAYNNRGQAYSEIGQGEEALLDFERAIELSPRDPTPYMNRGDLYSRHKPVAKFAEAIDDFTKAILINPNDASFHRCKAYACLKVGQLQEAIDSFTSNSPGARFQADLHRPG
jgi:Flp pilus assembly protein TadD